MEDTIHEVLSFWFGTDATDDAGIARRQHRLWWDKDAETDAMIRNRFAALHQRAISGALDFWTHTARGRLALVIVLDQFSRVLHRGLPAAFAQDTRALALSMEGQANGEDRELRPIERVFLYMPMEHAESLPVQDECVRRFERLLAEIPAPGRAPFESFLDFARQHRDIILRFGRFPHRNTTLGRESTPAEREFLSRPGSSF